ncbi:MAG: hypothetical protein K2I30_06490 [Clostridia bacterium]|nr:hypothetical protein [Clostridia bacterium]
MKSWLKFFGLSFFSDKIAKGAARRGILNFILGLALSLVFIFCGVLAANTAPFRTHYNNASEFKTFVRNSFDAVNLNIKDERVSAAEVVNFEPEEIAAKGYKLVIDTRPSTALDDFVAYCTPKSGGEEISYEEYLALPEEEKNKYDFKIRYTANELVLSEELTAGYEEYLDSSENQDIKKQYKDLSDKKGTLSAEEYRESVYALYLKAYYPDLSSYERTSVPRIRTYYYLNFLNKAELSEYLFVFDDCLIGNFKTDGGLDVSFYGVFDRIADGVVKGGSADAFIKEAFSGALPMMANVYSMSVFRFMPIILLMPLALAVISWGVLKALKTDIRYRKLTSCIKIQGSFLWFASLVCALIIFVCGFFVSGTVLNYLPLIVFFLILAVRTAVYLVFEKINKNKTEKQTGGESKEEQPE